MNPKSPPLGALKLSYSRGGKPPCNGCEDRHIDCHSDCEKYNNWKTGYDKVAKETNEKRNELNDILGYFLLDRKSRLK